MFCCTVNQSHNGQIVTSICKNIQCVESNHQLCCARCVQQKHKTHSVVSLKVHIAQLLKVQKQRIMQIQRMRQLIKEYFPEQYSETQNIQDNLRKTLSLAHINIQKKSEQIIKIREALKGVQQIQENSKISHIQNNLAISNLKYINSNEGFSHKAKHPHISVSSNTKTITKTTNFAQKVCGISSYSLNNAQECYLIRIDKSAGNIMIGVCHEQIIQDKQYINCYGMCSGSYILGQNGNSQTAICFHHSDPTYNRKQIVGWNFKEGQKIEIYINIKESLILFKNKAQDRQFTMAIPGIKNNLKLIILLQNINDQVTLLESQNGY